MEITLYKTLDADNVINKTLTNPFTLEINVRPNVDVINPEILLLRSSLDFPGYNYCVIPAFSRRYFVRDYELVNHSIARLYLECDVIESYKNEILASRAKFQRQVLAGDYGETELNFTGEVEVTNFESEVALEPFDNSLLTVLRWA